jgi:hypothetical protein
VRGGGRRRTLFITMEDYDNIAVSEGSFKFKGYFPVNLIGSGAF